MKDDESSVVSELSVVPCEDEVLPLGCVTTHYESNVNRRATLRIREGNHHFRVGALFTHRALASSKM